MSNSTSKIIITGKMCAQVSCDKNNNSYTWTLKKVSNGKNLYVRCSKNGRADYTNTGQKLYVNCIEPKKFCDAKANVKNTMVNINVGAIQISKELLVTVQK